MGNSLAGSVGDQWRIWHSTQHLGGEVVGVATHLSLEGCSWDTGCLVLLSCP